jgi:hypothetical protein
MITLKRNKPKRDITGNNSIASAIEPLFAQMNGMDFMTLKSEFIKILRDESIYASPATRSNWLKIAQSETSKNRLMITLGNLYLGGAALKVN